MNIQANLYERYNLTLEGLIVAFIAMWLGNVGGFHAATTETAAAAKAGLLFMIVGGFAASLLTALTAACVVYLFEAVVGVPGGEAA